MEQRDFLSSRETRFCDLTRDAIAGALAASRTGPSGRSDAETSRLLGDAIGSAARTAPAELIPAAVLVPLVRREDGLTVLLTQRTAHLSHHGGQISFPGGRMEPGDADPTAAALRETREEIGLPSEAVDILGRLDDYVTVTGFKVVPVVGLIHPPFTLIPESFEVQEIFEVPLSFVLNPVNHQRHSRVTPAGETRHFYAIPFGERYIWGATAAMLVNFYETLVR